MLLDVRGKLSAGSALANARFAHNRHERPLTEPTSIEHAYQFAQLILPPDEDLAGKHATRRRYLKPGRTGRGQQLCRL
jgi:hypothetical protein